VSYLLCIETSGPICSVCLSEEGGKVIAERSAEAKNLHSSVLHVYILDMFRSAEIQMNLLSAVAYSSGPGSYTGLRIGLSAAKGIAVALDIPLIEVSTLKSLAMAMRNEKRAKNGQIVAMIDAGRLEAYCQTFNSDMSPQNEAEAVILNLGYFNELRKDETVYIGGSGAEKCRTIIEENSLGINILADIRPNAKYLAVLAWPKFRENTYANVAYAVPNYLKSYKPQKKRRKVQN